MPADLSTEVTRSAYPVIELEPDFQKSLARFKDLNLSWCYTCGTCRNECPVFRATGRLSPLGLVRLAALGQRDLLFSSPEIWYCIRCNKCARSCPMTVKPSTLINTLRSWAVYDGRVGPETRDRYLELCRGANRAHWHLAQALIRGEKVELTFKKWRGFKEKPVPQDGEPVTLGGDGPAQGPQAAWDVSRAKACFTCGQCEGVCPVSWERHVFAPMHVFRQTFLGLTRELLSSPAIWLCIGCGRCTEACCQNVAGHLMIKGLKEMAIGEGAVDQSFPYRFEKAQKAAFKHFLREVDELLRA